MDNNNIDDNSFDDFYHELLRDKMIKIDSNYSQFSDNDVVIPDKKMYLILPNSKIEKSVKCKSSKQAYEIFNDILNYEEYDLRDQEHIWVMAIDKTGYVACIYVAAIGKSNSVTVEPVDILSTSVLYKAKKIVLAHNHPSAYDKISLSVDDYKFTENLFYGAKTIGIEIIDHIILGDNGYYSFLENGYMHIIQNSKMKKSFAEMEKEILGEKFKHGERMRKEGKRLGIKKGRKHGKKKEKMGIARNLLTMNMSVDNIILATGLTAVEIEKIKGSI